MSAIIASPAPDPSRRWVDRKYFLWLLSAAVPVIVCLSLATFTWLSRRWGIHGWTELALWLLPFLIYVVVPMGDMVFGDDRSNPPEEAMAALEASFYYRALLFAYTPVQYVVTIWCAWIVTSQALDVFGYAGAVLAAGGVNGLGINTAHELGHKAEAIDRWVSRLTLAPSAYGHFYVEHNRGHHLHVATPEDPASARMGESLWEFLPRTVWGSLVSAWRLERRRLNNHGCRAWSVRNQILQSWSMTILLSGSVTTALGWPALLFLIVQALYAISLLETVNYLEHYGLARRRLPNGRYEPCRPVHSWNSSHVVSNLLLYHLQRHSDHHAHPRRRYQTLRHFDESPQLPAGYATMIVLAYVPPLWRRVMDRRVAAHYGGDLDRAAIKPGRRSVVEAGLDRGA